MRNKIFISHATPDDNDFTRWLALKLIGLGYDVWCDIFELQKALVAKDSLLAARIE